MFKNDDDVRKTLQEIMKIKDTLDQHMTDKLDKPVSKETLMELEQLKLSVSFFSEFIQNFIKSLGLTDKDIARGMRLNVKGRDPAAEKLIQEADSIKCQLILSEAEFIKNQYKDYLESNRPYTETKKNPAIAETQKKKNKKKFKTMERRQKWNKM